MMLSPSLFFIFGFSVRLSSISCMHVCLIYFFFLCICNIVNRLLLMQFIISKLIIIPLLSVSLFSLLFLDHSFVSSLRLFDFDFFFHLLLLLLIHSNSFIHSLRHNIPIKIYAFIFFFLIVLFCSDKFEVTFCFFFLSFYSLMYVLLLLLVQLSLDGS